MNLSEEQIAHEKEFMRGLAPLNIGALFLPPVWGPAHGIWAAIFFYPLWLLADNCFYIAYQQATPVAIIMAVVVGVCLTAVTLVFARLGQPWAAHRYIEDKEVPREKYLRRERIWAVVGIVVGAAMIAAATYYNLAVRPNTGW